jgi:hypothetical protein
MENPTVTLTKLIDYNDREMAKCQCGQYKEVRSDIKWL